MKKKKTVVKLILFLKLDRKQKLQVEMVVSSLIMSLWSCFFFWVFFLQSDKSRISISRDGCNLKVMCGWFELECSLGLVDRGNNHNLRLF